MREKRGDFSSLEWAHPEIEYVIADGPTAGTWRGVPGMAEGWRDFLSAWDHFQVQVDEYRELDHERVLVLVLAWVGEWRDGRLVRLKTYTNTAEALEAVGLATS